MKQRLGILVVVLVASMMLWVQARAQDAAWTAWLYDAVSGRMTEVDNTGALISQFQLPAEPGSTYSLMVAISADGDLLAYSASTSDTTFVNVYSLSGQTTVYSTALSAGVGTSLDYSASAFNFSEGNSTFAFSFAAFGDSSNGWQVRVVDLATLGETTLNEGDTAASTIVSPGFGFTLPLVMYNRNQEVKFLMLPLGTDGMPRYDAYTWNTAGNTVAPDATYITPDVETLAQTGEAISTVSDSRFPDSSDPSSGFPSNNTLQVFDPAANERFIAAVLPRIYNATFIQGGERVAAVQYEILPDNIYDPSIQIIERSGQVSGTINETDKDEVTSLFGTANGFVYTVPSGSDSGGTQLYAVDTRAGTFTPVEVWESAPGSGGILMWAGDTNPVAAASFGAWGRVAETAPAEPTTPPIAPPATALTVGGEATVQTTEGEVLNLRSGAGTDFGLLGTVANGTVVTLLEGPTDAGGFFWWRVRLPSGTEGWVVESADGIETLIPR